MSESKTPLNSRRVAVTVQGVTQGVGFRPFVYRAARTRNLSGWVTNESDQVRIEVQGVAEAVADFLTELKNRPPAQARVASLEIAELELQEGLSTFEIRASGGGAAPRPTIPADLATCAECLAEISDPAERRHGYPFTNCTNCGPRWSIIERLPYDRPRTSMKTFAMCEKCLAEYENPADRRFHAQPIACPTCGPQLELLRILPSPSGGRYEAAGGEGCVREAANALLAGQILALKGLGGFQLAADATNASAVALLRERKRRPDRPFALMMRSLDEVRRYCEVSDEEAAMLSSHQAPIVLLRKKILSINDQRPTTNDQNTLASKKIAENIAPGNPYLGVMLPYTPLHHLLMAAVRRPIVCTSGNISEEPMAISIEEAVERLGGVADLFLTHNRPIVRPVDDSIIRFIGCQKENVARLTNAKPEKSSKDKELPDIINLSTKSPIGMQVLRRARGFAPLPIEIWNPSGKAILAVGGHLKSTVGICLQRGKELVELKENPPSPFPLPPYSSPAVVSSHIGDLDSLSSVEVFHRAVDDLVDFYAVEPDVVVCDLHPDYASTRHAETLAARWNVPLKRVQHHHAHVAACMAEHDLTGPVLGFAWDGTGYGSDGTIWGGEALVVSPNGDFTRAASIRTFALPGGDVAARQPRRSALGLLYEIFGEAASQYAEAWFAPGELKTLLKMLKRGTNCPRTSSLGRLFDAVAALVGFTGSITYEGQAAMSLEFAADSITPLSMAGVTELSDPGGRAYRLPLEKHESNILSLDWQPMVRQILADLASGESPGIIGYRFHEGLAAMAVEVAKTVDLPQIVLCGGCFQNALLLKLTNSRLVEAGFQVFLPQQFPPGDGGIALGQIYLAGIQAGTV
jgi:hydrogenase maturation protein HypF